MKEKRFYDEQKDNHIKWRETNIFSKENGWQNGKSYSHIIPKKIWTENLWKDIRTILPEYLKNNGVKEHSGVHNLLSSWIVCANVYFPIKYNEQLKSLFAKFLKSKVSDAIVEISDIQLEFAFEEHSDLHPSKLLGEQNGNRGSGQTSPDIAFIVKTQSGKNGIVLCENKYTEHSFYSCSARKIDEKSERVNNPDPQRCMVAADICNYKDVCHQFVWGRKYLNLINFSDYSKGVLKRCPAATAGYQLLRQQALAEGIANSNEYEFVASTVAFDKRNTTLIRCLESTGVSDFQSEWSNLFNGKALFKTWTHQEWIQFVRDNQKENEFEEWLNYLKTRYEY